MAKSNMMCGPHELTHHKRCLESVGQCAGARIANLVLQEAQKRDRGHWPCDMSSDGHENWSAERRTHAIPSGRKSSFATVEPLSTHCQKRHVLPEHLQSNHITSSHVTVRDVELVKTCRCFQSNAISQDIISPNFLKGRSTAHHVFPRHGH